MIRSNETSRAKAVKELSNYGVEKVVKVCGGYMGFETADEYKTWKNQK